MKKLTFMLVAIATLSACRKIPDTEQLSYKPIVATPHNPGVDFTQYKTYYIPDTIAIVNSERPFDSTWTDADAKKIIQRIKENMNERGFVYKELSENPDLVIPTLAIKVTTEVSGGYWWGYPGYWDPWYWGGYYYYYPYYYEYDYTTGSFIMDLCDRKNIEANEGKINILWTGFLGGYISDYRSTNIPYVLEGIDQAFDQSRYLKAGN